METIDIQLPVNLETMTLPAPELVNYWRFAEDRTFFIDYDVDSGLTEIIKSVIYINKKDRGIPVENRKPITLCIYSYGGDLDAAFALIAACEASLTPIVTVNMGIAMSAGLMIFLAGRERYCFKRSQALIHSGSASNVAGTYEQIAAFQESYDRSVKAMKDYILERSEIPSKTFNKKKSTDWYLTDEEQVAYGIAHKIVSSLDDFA